MRYPPSLKEDETERWYLLDTKEEIDQLLSALNMKGIKEKNLHDTINFNLKHGFLLPIPELERNPIIENSSTSMKKLDNNDKLSEILTTLISTQSPNDKLERNTRGRPKKNSNNVKKQPLSLEIIKEMLFKAEIYFNNYLTQRSSRWLIEEERIKYVKLTLFSSFF